ncbi:hypothetical protein Anas_08518 [Armadillidium nasatum]|uniref:Uncharacterized protein n=1 Tax=Armadillidium nasatum TaxID=96803 RepID=A0A5N5TL86_9CRUS|nr:hypothetical protein Anas_08518 [Armadillidium nasatum]
MMFCLTYVRETLLMISVKLFLTVERIHELWVGPPNGITEAELDLLEEKYSSCHRLVANFLSALASVKFCPLGTKYYRLISLELKYTYLSFNFNVLNAFRF